MVSHIHAQDNFSNLLKNVLEEKREKLHSQDGLDMVFSIKPSGVAEQRSMSVLRCKDSTCKARPISALCKWGDRKRLVAGRKTVHY